MFYDPDHPNVTLPDWEEFKETARSQYMITKVVDRKTCGFFPDEFMPLARGVVIASPALLDDAGYRLGRACPRDWVTNNGDVYWLELGRTRGA
jgi:hypothetical protein